MKKLRKNENGYIWEGLYGSYFLKDEDVWVINVIPYGDKEPQKVGEAKNKREALRKSNSHSQKAIKILLEEAREKNKNSLLEDWSNRPRVTQSTPSAVAHMINPEEFREKQEKERVEFKDFMKDWVKSARLSLHEG